MSDRGRRKNGRDIRRHIDDRSVVCGGSRHSVSHNGTGGEDMTRDIIDRQKAINAIANTECHISTSEWNELVDAIINLPSAQPSVSDCWDCKCPKMERLSAVNRWIPVFDNRGGHFVCSNCGDWRYYIGQKYCGECGSRNEVESDETD